MPPFTFDAFPELETERLLLRRILPADAADWARLFGHPEVTAYLVDIEDDAGDEAHAVGIIAWADEIFGR
jgi:RimJ/RimL family protein N-acetyltransferase